MRYLFAALIVLFCAVQGLAAKVVVIDTITFKGFESVSKYEIVKKAGIRSKDKKIFVDVEKLVTVLSEDPRIKTYKLIDKNNSLTILVTESSVAYNACIVGSAEGVYCELDASFNIISVNQMGSLSKPLLLFDRDDLENNRICSQSADRVKELIGFVKNETVWPQVTEIDFTSVAFVGIRLEGRPTLFILGNNKESFERLDYIIGYFDKASYYPERVDLRDRMVVFK